MCVREEVCVRMKREKKECRHVCGNEEREEVSERKREGEKKRESIC